MRYLRSALLLTLFTFPALAAEMTVAGLVETYDNPTLGTATSISNGAWSHGHLKLTLTSGVAAPIVAGGETIGIYFKGNGSYTLVSEDPTEAAVLETNVKNSTGLRVEKSGGNRILSDTFTDLMLWTSGVALPAGGAEGAAANAAQFEEHRKIFAREQSPASFMFVKAKMDGATAPVVRAEFSGGKENAVYLYDPLISHAETLYTLHRIRRTTIREYQQALFPAVLSQQLIGYTRKQFVEPAYLLFGLDYSLVADGADAKLAVTETIVPMGKAQRVFQFYQNSRDYDSNNKQRVYNVRSVKDEKGTALSFVHRDGELLVGLPAAAPADQPFKLQFEIDGDFLIRPSGDSYWELGTSAWFPQPDLNGQFYTVHSTVKVKKPFVPFAPGETVRRVTEGDFNVVENKIDKPVQFAVVLAGRYAFSEETQDGVTIRVATYAGKNELAMKKLSSLAFKMIKFYEPFLGPFPFKEFNIIEINEYGYGQAPPATMFITQEAFNPLADEMNRIFSKGINHRFAHEIAHQYWGHAVKMPSGEEQWITESFAEYSSSFIVGEIKGKSGRQAMINTWRANANDSKNMSSIALANRLRDYGDGYSAFMHRTNLMYSKGAYVLYKLHEQIGDTAFFSFLRNFQAMKEFKYATTAEMVPLLERLTKKDYTEFFDKYYWGTEMP
jgi:hypothetical protein